MKATLLVVAGKTTRRQVALKLPCVLGRSPQADVTVAHPLISRRHCELSETNGLLVLRDMASLNGTMIGRRRIVSAPLLPGAEFSIGPLVFRVEYAYQGDLESLPQTSYFNEVAEATVDLSAAAPAHQVSHETRPQPAARRSNSEIGEVTEFSAWADADPDEVVLALPSLHWPPAPPDKRPDAPAPAPQEDGPSEHLQ